MHSLTALALCAAVAAPAAPAAPAAVAARGRPCSRADSTGILQPTDAAFADAEAFRGFLGRQRIVVHCVIRSHFASFLWPAPEAAFLTDKGDIEVRFFRQPDGAEQVRIVEGRVGTFWRYTFPPNSRPADTLVTERRQYFIQRRRWLVMLEDSTTAVALRWALMSEGGRQGPGWMSGAARPPAR